MTIAIEPTATERATLQAEVAAWEARRNTAARPLDWRFTTADARVTLKHLYPSFDA